jgi:hypothetical protein
MTTAGELHDITINIPICKVDDSKRLVVGVVLEPDLVDAQNDTIPADVIETAAHDYLANYNKATELGIQHDTFGDIGVELVESYIAPVDFEINGVTIKKGTWVMVVHVSSDDVWLKVLSGEITGFSIGGTATVPADTDDETDEADGSAV